MSLPNRSCLLREGGFRSQQVSIPSCVPCTRQFSNTHHHTRFTRVPAASPEKTEGCTSPRASRSHTTDRSTLQLVLTQILITPCFLRYWAYDTKDFYYEELAFADPKPPTIWTYVVSKASVLRADHTAMNKTHTVLHFMWDQSHLV